MNFNNYSSFNYDRLKKLKICDIIYECSGGYNVKLEVVQIPYEQYNTHLKANQLKWVCINENNERQNFLVTKGLEHYGPKIYSFPVYIIF